MILNTFHLLTQTKSIHTELHQHLQIGKVRLNKHRKLKEHYVVMDI